MDESIRKQLHDRLDQILDRRSAIEPEQENALLPYLHYTPLAVKREDAHALWIAVIALAKDILGDFVRTAAIDRLYDHESEQRQLLKGWFLDLYPLLFTSPQTTLAIAPKSELTVFDVIDALSALDAGEIRPLFLANTGKARRANRWSLANRKLEALVWKRRLRALGHAEKAANFEITKAFGEQWDTIRKWKTQCQDILGSAEVESRLSYAGSPADYYLKKPPGGLFGGLKLDPVVGLNTAGAAYRSEVARSAELSKRKARVA